MHRAGAHSSIHARPKLRVGEGRERSGLPGGVDGGGGEQGVLALLAGRGSEEREEPIHVRLAPVRLQAPGDGAQSA
jgi:hypothetical protein